MDRFPQELQVHLEPSDISEVTSKRVLSKNAAAQKLLRAKYEENRGRLAGSTLLARLGQTRVLVYGGVATFAGMITAALAPVLPLALVGFALAGLGVANAFPTAMARVGILGGPHGVAIASTLGYAGFLLGPPAIGFLAGAISLRVALTTVSLLALVAIVLARTASSPRQARDGH